MRSLVVVATVIFALTVGFLFGVMAQLGYEDTPLLPTKKWRVHDSKRPQPPVIIPGKTFGDPPSDAIILFDGKDLSKWRSAWTGGPARWKVENGYMEIVTSLTLILSRHDTSDKHNFCQGHFAGSLPEGDEPLGDRAARSWSRRWDLNPRPGDYKSPALPLSYGGFLANFSAFFPDFCDPLPNPT